MHKGIWHFILINPGLIFFQATTFSGPSCSSVSKLSSRHISHFTFLMSESVVRCRTGSRQELCGEDRPHGLHPMLLNFAWFWSHRDPGLHEAAVTHSLCPKFAFQQKNDTLLLGANLQLEDRLVMHNCFFLNVLFTFLKSEMHPAGGLMDSGAEAVAIECHFRLIWCCMGGHCRGPLLSVPATATLAFAWEKVTLSGTARKVVALGIF